MKKKIYFLLFVSFFLFSGVSCGQEGRESYEVVLPGSLESGCEWQYRENPTQSVMVIKNEYTETDREEGEVEYSFVFVGKKKGETEILFEYVDEETQEVRKTVTIQLKVKKDKTMIEKEIQKSDETLEVRIK